MRHRERVFQLYSGKKTHLWDGAVDGPTMRDVGHQGVLDEVGLRDRDNPLHIQHKNVYYVPFEGENSFFRFESYVPSSIWRFDSQLWGGLRDSSPSDAAAVTAMLARSNPSRPVVSLPVAIAELREVPSLMKWAGEKLIRKGPAAFLSYQFGWKPLISDINKTVDFSGHFDKRAKELEKLYSLKGLKRRMTLHNSTDLVSDTFNLSQTPFVILKGRKTFKIEVWATVRWKPTILPPISSRNQGYRDLARGVATGLSAYRPSRPDFAGIAQDAWNLFPWSWLADWYGNAGDFLGAHRNAIPAEHGNVCVMRKYTMEASYDSHTALYLDGITGGRVLQISSVDKKRYVGNAPQLTADIPFLNGRQMSILGALGVLRLPKKMRFT